MLVKCSNCGKEMDINELTSLEVFAYHVPPNNFTTLDGDGDCPQCKQWIRFSFEAIILEREDYEKKCDKEYEKGFDDGHDLGCKQISEIWGEQHRKISLGKEVKFQDAFDQGYKIGYNDGYQDAEDVYSGG